MSKKYELTTQSIEWKGRKLFRIKAVKSFADVKVGDLGGYIESESNLSQDGTAWVSDDAKVYDTARVFGNASVRNNAEIYENANVFGRADVFGNVEVYGSAEVFDNAKICGDTEIFGAERIGSRLICQWRTK